MNRTALKDARTELFHGAACMFIVLASLFLALGVGGLAYAIVTR